MQENFDAVDRLRDNDDGIAIETADFMLDASGADRASQLPASLLSKQYLIVQTPNEKRITYAPGRSIDPADTPTVRAVLRNAAAHDYRFSSIICGIVSSTAQQMHTVGFASGNSVVAAVGEQ